MITEDLINKIKSYAIRFEELYESGISEKNSRFKLLQAHQIFKELFQSVGVGSLHNQVKKSIKALNTPLNIAK